METSQIRAFRKKLRRFDRLNDLFNDSCCAGVTLAQCHALLEIEELGETTIIQLAHNLMLDKSTLSRTVDGLVKQGWVERKPHAPDRRYVTLVLTDEGHRICKNINEKNDSTYGKMLSHLSPYELQSLMMNFELFVQVMSDYIQGKNMKECC